MCLLFHLYRYIVNYIVEIGPWKIQFNDATDNLGLCSQRIWKLGHRDTV